VHTVPIRGAGAIQAARLAMDEVVSGSKDGLQTAVRILLDDSRDTPRTHALAMAESDQTLEVLAAWSRRAGLSPGRLIPLRGVQLIAAVREAARWKSPQRGAMVYLDGEGTVIIGRDQGRTPFIRSMDFGYSMFTDAIVRGLRGAGAVQTLERIRAGEILFATGLPRRGEVLDPSTGLRADTVLPLMQPVLQGYVMEIRQTLRFGFGDLESASADVVLAGSGSSIPELAETLANQLELSVERMPGPRVLANPESGELVDVVQFFDELPAFTAASEESRRVRRSLRTAMACGIVLGGLAVAGTTTITSNDARELEVAKQAIQPEIDRISAYRGEIETAHTSVEALMATRAALDQALGLRSNWRAGLGAIAQCASESISIGEISAGHASDGGSEPVITVRGVASAPTDATQPGTATGDDAIGHFVQQLSKHPMVASAQVVSSRTDGSGEATSRVFTVSVRLLSAPSWSLAEVTEGAR
jgi:hypothetical protein